MFTFLLLAACMQYDEGIAPAHRNGNGPDVLNNEAADGAMVSAMAKKTFVAHLNSGNETANVESSGQGQAIFQLNEDGTALSYKLIVANIDDVVVAHIHCGAEGANGPPVAFVFQGGPVTTNGILAEGMITGANVIPRSPAQCAPNGVQTFDDLLALLRSGMAYVNAHTPDYPGGEIRGQIK